VISLILDDFHHNVLIRNFKHFEELLKIFNIYLRIFKWHSINKKILKKLFIVNIYFLKKIIFIKNYLSKYFYILVLF
jgi:hypothetical protein